LRKNKANGYFLRSRCARVINLKTSRFNVGWHHRFLRLAARARAPIVPVHVVGRNSLAFYAAANIASPLATSRRPYPASLPEVLAQFSGDNYSDNLRRLKHLLANLGTAIPTLYKQYSEVCEPGGVQFIDFGSDPDFNHCIDGLVLVDLTRVKPARYERYIGMHL
jgi:hypothetical protein